MQTLLIATHNQGKLREYRTLLADLPLAVVNLDEAGITFDVDETGTTFRENAILKAETYAAAVGAMTWADDSGLEVDALNGAPGVYSARYAGPGATDADRYRKLLEELAGMPDAPRTARFRCVVAVVLTDGETLIAEGAVQGEIIDEPRGTHGFGYDPVFYLPEHGCTMAELPPETKNAISHRGIASRAAHDLLVAHLGRREGRSG